MIGDAEAEMTLIEASLTLSVTGPNETARKASVTLAVHQDAGYQEYQRTTSEARTHLADIDRRLTVLKARMRFGHAPLALQTAHASGGAEV